MTPELEAAVERVTETARLTEQITRLAAWTVDPTTFPEPCVDDVRALLSALAASEARLAEAYRLGFEASAEGWNGEYPFEGVNLEASPSEHALAWRKGRAGDLNPQQEGSRDHG